MDGRVVFSFTFDNIFHAWFSQVCMASFGDFLDAAGDRTSARKMRVVPPPALRLLFRREFDRPI
jgi:hypothetical protein